MAIIPSKNIRSILGACLSSAETNMMTAQGQPITGNTVTYNTSSIYNSHNIQSIGAGIGGAGMNTYQSITTPPKNVIKTNLIYRTTTFTQFVEYVCGPEYLEGTKFHNIISRINTIPYKFTQFCIAGGSLRDLFIGKDFKDIDVYMYPTFKQDIFDSAIKNKKLFYSKFEKFGESFSTTYAVTQYYKYFNTVVKVQYVKAQPHGLKIVSGTPEEIINGFDFTCNQFVLHGDNKITYSNYAMGDLLARRLRMINSENITDKSHFKARLFKFIEKGFKPDYDLINALELNI